MTDHIDGPILLGIAAQARGTAKWRLAIERLA